MVLRCDLQNRQAASVTNWVVLSPSVEDVVRTLGGSNRMKNWHLLLPWLTLHHLRPRAELVDPV